MPGKTTEGKKRRCLCGCGEMFTPTRSWQRYFSAQCGNRHRQQRMVKRARIAMKLGQKLRELAAHE